MIIVVEGGRGGRGRRVDKIAKSGGLGCELCVCVRPVQL